MTPGIVPKLYRGDSDSRNIRDLKQTLHHGQLQTALLKGGLGHLIFTSPLEQLINDHVGPGWTNTHFLSFTEEELTAYSFGMNCDYSEAATMLESYSDYFEVGIDWDFALIEIDNGLIDWKEITPGVFEGKYLPTLLKFKEYPGMCSVVLIDVCKAIESYPMLPDYDLVKSNANRDKEWLLLPTTPTILNNGKMENSGILDGYFISDIRKYIKR